MPVPEYHIRNQVFLDASDIKTTQHSLKLTHQYLSAYMVQQKVGQNAYQLLLPRSLAHLHPVFNVVKLLPGQKVRLPLPPEIVYGEEHYEVVRILDCCFIKDQLYFLVKWKGYSYEENSWIPEEDLAAPVRLWEFYATHPGAP